MRLKKTNNLKFRIAYLSQFWLFAVKNALFIGPLSQLIVRLYRRIPGGSEL